MIAVMGAAGNVGGKLADLLLQGDQEVRVLQHRRTLEELGERGAEVVTGDGLQVEDLRRLFTGADAAFVLLPDNVDDPRFVANRSRMSQAITDALRETRVGHVVALSMVGADRAGAPGPPAGSTSTSGGWPASGTPTCWCCGRPPTWTTCRAACP
jgi:uncharacterized protein YbjT (DUF2867 family)